MNTKLFCIFLIALYGIQLSYSTLYQVGPTRDLKLPTEVDWANINAGDIIEIDWREEPYLSKWIISRLGTEENPIIIRGISGPNGEKPIIDAANATSRSGMSFPNQQRSLLRIGGASSGPNYADHLIVENLVFRNAKPGNWFYTHGGVYTEYVSNAAAIWIERGQNIVIRNCEIYDSVFGINTNGGYENHTIEYNYIYSNGFAGTSNPNIHTDSRHTVIQFNRFGPLVNPTASNIRDRSAGTIIRYNWIEGGNRQLEINHNADYSTHPDFGTTFIYGNVIMEPFGVTDNKQMIFYGGTNADHRLFAYNNNILSYRNDGNNVVASSAPGFYAFLTNNIIHNPRNGNIALTDASPNLYLHGNYLPSSYTNGVSTGNLTFDDNLISSDQPGFIDGLGFNFTLLPESICKGVAVALPELVLEKGLVPNMQYVVHSQSDTRGADADLGAFSDPFVDVTTTGAQVGTTGSADQGTTGAEPATTGSQPESTTGSQPESTTGAQPESTTGEQPSVTTGAQPESTTGEQPATTGQPTEATTGEQPSVTTGQQAPVTTGSQPSATTGEQPAATTGQQPAATTGEQPSATTGEQPAATTGQPSSATTGSQPSATTGEQPAATTGAQPSATTGEQPSATTGEQPSATTGEQPAATTGSQPSVTTGEQPAATTGTSTTGTSTTGPQQPTVVAATVVLRIQGSLETFNTGTFRASLALILGISSNRIVITDLRAGSVVVTFDILDAPAGSNEKSGASAATELKEKIDNNDPSLDNANINVISYDIQFVQDQPDDGQRKSSSSGLSDAALVGIIVGAVAFVAIVLIALVIFVRAANRNANKFHNDVELDAPPM